MDLRIKDLTVDQLKNFEGKTLFVYEKRSDFKTIFHYILIKKTLRIGDKVFVNCFSINQLITGISTIRYISVNKLKNVDIKKELFDKFSGEKMVYIKDDIQDTSLEIKSKINDIIEEMENNDIKLKEFRIIQQQTISFSCSVDGEFTGEVLTVLKQ